MGQEFSKTLLFNVLQVGKLRFSEIYALALATKVEGRFRPKLAELRPLITVTCLVGWMTESLFQLTHTSPPWSSMVPCFG